MRGARGAFAFVLGTAALMVVPVQAGAVSFFRGDFPVGTHPVSVAVGNFNGGAPDLAVANEGSNNISILLGNGFGQFTATASVPAGATPSSVVTGSFNGDAFTDLAIASTGDDNIAIRLGDGAGAFSGTGTVATGLDPRQIATGDFNGDTKADLVSANTGSSTISILLGDGMGAFSTDATPENVATAAANPVAIAVGRVENPAPPGTPDPDLDAVIASQADDQVLLLLGDGAGGFDGSATYYGAMGNAGTDPSAVAFGSLNPSSPNPSFAAEPDLLTVNQGPDNLFPAYGRIDGVFFDFGSALTLATGAEPVAVALGDFDGDGDDDGISANSGTGTATLILSDGGGGTSVDTSSPVGSSPRAVAAGGFDADGRAGRRGRQLQLELGHGPDLTAAGTGGRRAPAPWPGTPEEVQEGQEAEEGKVREEEAEEEEVVANGCRPLEHARLSPAASAFGSASRTAQRTASRP